MTPEDETTNHPENEHDLNPLVHEEGQMFTDEFIGEAIGLGKLKQFDISINEQAEKTEERVRVKVVMDLPSAIGGGFYEETFVAYEKTMGLALREVREAVREEAGK